MEEKYAKPSGALLDYFMALERITSKRPNVVPKKARITLNLVALEAGRKAGSIKSGRKEFAHLIVAIEEAAAVQDAPNKAEQDRKRRDKETLQRVIDERNGALSREISLLHEVYQLKRKLADITGTNVFPLRSQDGSDKQV